MKLFLQKKCKIFERWGLRPQTPVPSAAGGFAPKPPASGGWGPCPQTPIGLRRLGAPPPDPQNSPPHCEFLATRLVIYHGQYVKIVLLRLECTNKCFAILKILRFSVFFSNVNVSSKKIKVKRFEK